MSDPMIAFGPMILIPDIGGSVQCPCCQERFSPEFSTEYGDPLAGEYSGRCLKCITPITIEVVVTVTYKVTKT